MSKEQLKLENQICFPLYATSRLITKAYKPHLDKLNLTYPQYLVMLVLWEEDGVPIKHITEKLLLETNTVTPLLKRMEGQGLLKKVRSESDERSVQISLTEKGRLLEERALDVPQAIAAHLSSTVVSGEDIMKLQNFLCKWLESLKSRE